MDVCYKDKLSNICLLFCYYKIYYTIILLRIMYIIVFIRYLAHIKFLEGSTGTFFGKRFLNFTFYLIAILTCPCILMRLL